MRSYIPGTMSPKYVEALGDLQDDILRSITASDEDSERYRAADPDWIKEAEEREKIVNSKKGIRPN